MDELFFYPGSIKKLKVDSGWVPVPENQIVKIKRFYRRFARVS